MSAKKNPFQAYTQATHTVPKTRQVVMLYDGAIRFMQQAVEAIRCNDIPERYNKLVKTSNILIGLQGSLDFESGGEMARTLYDFYAGLEAKILMVHRIGKVEPCEEVIEQLKSMRAQWDHIDKSEREGMLPSAAAAFQPESSAGETDQPVTISA